MPSCAQRLTVFGHTWRSSATCAVRRYLGWVVWGTHAPVLAVVPRLGDDPMPVGVGCHRAFYTGWPSCAASRCSLVFQPVHSWTLTSLSLLAPDLELRQPPTAVAPAQATGMHSHRRAGRHARMPGCDKQWPSPLLCARQGCTFCLATRRSSSSLATGASVGRRWSRPPRRWREGQVHDGWNREMVQRR
jgi:hypothetical protein